MYLNHFNVFLSSGAYPTVLFFIVSRRAWVSYRKHAPSRGHSVRQFRSRLLWGNWKSVTSHLHSLKYYKHFAHSALLQKRTLGNSGSSRACLNLEERLVQGKSSILSILRCRRWGLDLFVSLTVGPKGSVTQYTACQVYLIEAVPLAKYFGCRSQSSDHESLEMCRSR